MMEMVAKYSRYKNSNSAVKKIYSKLNFGLSMLGLEGVVWICAIAYLALFVNPVETHFTICPLSNLGFDFCPGCGLGNAISLLFRGKIGHSIETHLLGIPALIFLLLRIISIIKFNFTIHHKLKIEERTQHA